VRGMCVLQDRKATKRRQLAVARQENRQEEAEGGATRKKKKLLTHFSFRTRTGKAPRLLQAGEKRKEENPNRQRAIKSELEKHENIVDATKVGERRRRREKEFDVRIHHMRIHAISTEALLLQFRA
jgi:hypothetical protein